MKAPALTLGLATAAVLLALPATAHEKKAGSLSIAHPFVVLDKACKAPLVRGYVMQVANEGAAADRLTGAELQGAGKGTLIRVVAQGGKSFRQPLATGVDVPAQGRATLMLPGHAIEFPKPKAALVEGGMVKGTLVFEKAGRVPVEFMVESTHLTADTGPVPCELPTQP